MTADPLSWAQQWNSELENAGNADNRMENVTWLAREEPVVVRTKEKEITVEKIVVENVMEDIRKLNERKREEEERK